MTAQLGGQEPPQEAVDWLAPILGRLMMRHGDDGDVFEWHECDDCHTGPCPCSGQPWARNDFTAAVLTALRDALAKGGPEGEQVAAALGLTVEEIPKGYWAWGSKPAFRVVGPWVEVTP